MLFVYGTRCVLQTTNDGEYELVLGGKNISVYCHNMASTYPKEYITLRANVSENYSEVYGKRLINPNTCPHNATREK